VSCERGQVARDMISQWRCRRCIEENFPLQRWIGTFAALVKRSMERGNGVSASIGNLMNGEASVLIITSSSVSADVDPRPAAAAVKRIPSCTVIKFTSCQRCPIGGGKRQLPPLVSRCLEKNAYARSIIFLRAERAIVRRKVVVYALSDVVALTTVKHQDCVVSVSRRDCTKQNARDCKQTERSIHVRPGEFRRRRTKGLLLGNFFRAGFDILKSTIAERSRTWNNNPSNS